MMREMEIIERRWKEMQNWMPFRQICSLSLLLAFAACYGANEQRKDHAEPYSREDLLRCLSPLREHTVWKAIDRLTDDIRWELLNQDEVRSSLDQLVDCFSRYAGNRTLQLITLLFDLAAQNGEYSDIPPTIRKLICGIWRDRHASKLVIIGCGGAGLGFMLWDQIHRHEKSPSVYAEDRLRDACDWIRLYAFAYQIENLSVTERHITAVPDPQERQLYDMIVTAVPRGRNVTELVKFPDPRTEGFSNRQIYMDWLIIEDVLYRLNDHGAAALIVTPGALVRKNEEELRRQIIEHDCLEAVITLPENLYPKDPTGSELLLFHKHKAHQGKVLFVDISPYGVRSGRNFCTITEEGAELVRHSVAHFTEIRGVSAVVSCQQIAENNYSFKPLQYIQQAEEAKYTSMLKLEQIAQITRGAQVLRKDNLIDNGDLYFINVKDIQNNAIHFDQADRIAWSQAVCKEKYRIQLHDILLTSKGTQLKAAIVEEEPPQAYISGNITMIRVDPDRYDPYVLFEFFLSPQGKIALERIQSGTTIRILSNSSLRQLSIPKYEKEQMRMIGKALRENQQMYRQQLCEAENRFQTRRKALLEALKG